MFSPPPGYPDLLSDAEGRMRMDSYQELTVPEIGVVKACKPCPASTAVLAMSANPSSAGQERLDYLVKFASQHLEPGEMERLYFMMMVDALPTNTVERVTRSVATFGTARPYAAVVTLAVLTGHHWRTMRHKMLSAGIADPMRLTSMHALLDFTESVVVESIANSENGQRELAGFYRRMYGPESAELNGDGYQAAPAGFDDDEVESAFDAFARAAR